jgi:hypothetical protein
MAKSKTPPAESVTITLTPEEIATILAIREQQANPSPSIDPKAVGHQELANALITAIESTKAPAKKTSFNRTKKGPWEAKEGKVKPKLRRGMYQHGIELTEGNLHPQEIELLNQVKAGTFCQGFVKVIKRKDRSLDIDYPVKTASQRLRLVNTFGVRNFSELLQRLVDEANDPRKFKGPDDDDDE